MFLGSAEWVEWWRRRLAAEPVRENVPAQRKLAWRPTLEDVAWIVSEAFSVELAELCVSRRHGNEARSAAIYLARQVTDEPVGMIGKYFGGVSMAAISKTVARVDRRRQEDRTWDRRLAKLLQRLMTSEALRNKS
jgi:chromosomal replication initiation ATPase DnaA